jgi:plastocyanin
MAEATKSRFLRALTGTAVLVVLAAAMSAAATRYTVLFGGSVGLSYSPSSLSVSVGDTITWSGSFSSHPLSSTTIPAAAPSWLCDSGTLFSYVVTVPGSYNYVCDFHQGSGMAGSFTAAATGVADDRDSGPAASFQLLQNYPNPFNPSTTIGYVLPQKARVTVTVLNLIGQELATLVRGEQEAGYHEVKFDGGGLPSGVYVYKLQAGTFVQSRKLVLLR